MKAESSRLHISANIDIMAAQAQYKATGRVQIADILSQESAQQLYQCLHSQQQWNLVFNQNGQHIDTNAQDVDQWNETQKTQLQAVINEQAKTGFQYHYCAIPVYDLVHQQQLNNPVLHSAFELLNSNTFLTMVRTIVGNEEVGFVDAQATRYGAGHFLNQHDDDVAGKNRVAAYVLNLTPEWPADWGGALQFFDQHNNVEQAWKPMFNGLNLFKVPSVHSVAPVAAFAGGQRYAITGWLRSGADPLKQSS